MLKIGVMGHRAHHPCFFLKLPRQRKGIMYKIIHIESLDLTDLELYAHLNENQLRHYFEPEAGVFIGESPNVILRALEAGYEPISMLMEERYAAGEMPAAAAAAEVESESAEGVRRILAKLAGRTSCCPVYVSSLKVLSEITGYHLIRGILCAFRRRTLPSVTEVCRNARRVAVLDNVENPTNVGAIIRSAAALGMDAVLLSPGCADPLYRRAIRVSVGTVFQVPWTYIGVPERHYTWMKNFRPEKPAGIAVRADGKKTGQAGHCGPEPGNEWPEKGMEQLHDLGFCTAALALDGRAIPIDDPRLAEAPKLALILGNEGEGLPAATIAACDYLVTIPMSHGVDSLNVAAASAVAFWQLRAR